MSTQVAAAADVPARARTSSQRLSQLAVVAVASGAFAIAFPRYTELQVGGSFVGLSDVLFVLAGTCWLVALLRGTERIVWRRAYAPLLAYVVCAAASYLYAPDRRAWLVHTAAALYQAGFCVMLAHLLVERERRLLIARAWLLGAAVTVVLGLAGVALFYLGVKDRQLNPFLWNYGSVPVGNYPRLCASFRNGNAFCNYLVISVGVAVAFERELPLGVRRFLPAAVGAALVVALFTLSPGFGGLLLLLALWYWWSARGARFARWVLVAGAGAAFAFALLSVVSVTPAGEGDVSLGPLDVAFSGSPRISVWSSTLETIGKDPVFGQGLGAPLASVTDPRVFVPHDQLDAAALAKRWPPHIADAHNTWLSITAQLGVLGLALFSGFLFQMFKQLAAARSRVRYGLLATLVGGVLYHGLFISLEEMRHVWLLFGLALALAYSNGAEEASGLGPATLPESSYK